MGAHHFIMEQGAVWDNDSAGQQKRVRGSEDGGRGAV